MSNETLLFFGQLVNSGQLMGYISQKHLELKYVKMTIWLF